MNDPSRIVLTREETEPGDWWWVAVCLDQYNAAQARTPTDALRALATQIENHALVAEHLGEDPRIEPAPADIWEAAGIPLPETVGG